MEQSSASSDAAVAIVVLFFIFAFFIISLLPTIFYLISMQKALGRCKPENRLMQPGLVWLNLIPGFNLIWQFFTVIYVSGSLGREFRHREISTEPEPGKSVGLAMCILNLCGIIPYIGILPAIGGFVCWIIYWVKIAECSRQLGDAPPPLTIPHTPPPSSFE